MFVIEQNQTYATFRSFALRSFSSTNKLIDGFNFRRLGFKTFPELTSNSFGRCSHLYSFTIFLISHTQHKIKYPLAYGDSMRDQLFDACDAPSLSVQIGLEMDPPLDDVSITKTKPKHRREQKNKENRKALLIESNKKHDVEIQTVFHRPKQTKGFNQEMHF